MTDKTTHKPGCEALGGYGHGIGPCSCSEAQPEALAVAEGLDSTRNAFGDDNAQSKRRAAAELRRQHAEIQQLKAQLSARQAAPDGREPIETVKYWRDAYANPQGDKHFMGHGMVVKIMDDHLAMLSATPPPHEREPLTDEQIDDLCGEANRGFYIEPEQYLKAFRDAERAHGIGATND